MPVAGHSVAVGIELCLDAGEIFDGLAFRRFDFKFQEGCWPIDVQNMRLTHIPKAEPGRCDGNDRETNRDQAGEKPKTSYPAPIKHHENGAWRNNERHDKRDRDGKITGTTLHGRDMKRGREGRAQSKAEN